MRFDKFLEEASKNFNITRTGDGTYLISRGGRTVEVIPRENCNYKEFASFFSQVPIDVDVGDDDLYPTGLGSGSGDRIRGSLLDRDHPLFQGRPLHKEGDIRFPRFAKFDPLVPSKDRHKGFEPDPDHLRKPGPGGGSLF